MDFAISGISVGLLIIGIVEAAKEFGVTGNGSRVLALALGVLFVGLSQAIVQNLISPGVLPWIKLGVTALAGGLAAMGYYDFVKKNFSNDRKC